MWLILAHLTVINCVEQYLIFDIIDDRLGLLLISI